MSETVIVELLAKGGLGTFAIYMLWSKLSEMAKSMKGMSDAFIRMEERGYHIQGPTSGLPRASTEDGSV